MSDPVELQPSAHAISRLRARGITARQCDEAVHAAIKRGRFRRRDDRIVCYGCGMTVIIDSIKDPPVIVTAYWGRGGRGREGDN